MEYEKYIDIIPVNYTDDELTEISNKMEFEYGELEEQWATEIANLYASENFDPYSRKGERQLNKITNKYADMTADIILILEDIAEEQAKRDEYYEQQRYITGGKVRKKKELSTEEFLEKEDLRTLSHKQNIDYDDDF